MIIALDVHKNTVYVTEMLEDGYVKEQYDIGNDEEAWKEFTEKYSLLKPQIALEVSTSGKYVARMLRNNGFSVHMADASKLSLIFNSPKKNDREDSYKLAKLLRLGELPEVHLPSEGSDNLKSLVRYRRSLGQEMTVIKNRIHAILALHGLRIDATDIFGRRGLREIEELSSRLSSSERIVMEDMLMRVSDIIDRERKIEDQIALAVKDNNEVKLLMTIPGINIYSAAAIISEIDDISRFSSKEKFASYAGLVPRQDQSGTVNRMGHITKRGPSMLRFILVVAAHTAIRRSNRFRAKYQGIVRRVGRNRAIVAIARILAETIYSMLKEGMEFIDGVDSMTEKKIKSMVSRASSAKKNAEVTQSIKLLREKRLRGSPVKLFS